MDAREHPMTLGGLAPLIMDKGGAPGTLDRVGWCLPGRYLPSGLAPRPRLF